MLRKLTAAFIVIAALTLSHVAAIAQLEAQQIEMLLAEVRAAAHGCARTSSSPRVALAMPSRVCRLTRAICLTRAL